MSPRPRALVAVTLALLSILALNPARAYALQSDDTTLRIYLSCFEGARTIEMSSSSKFSVVRSDTGDEVASGKVGSRVTLEAGESEVFIAATDTNRSGVGRCVVVLADETIEVSADGRTRAYRGAVEVVIDSGGLRLVNVVSVEDYLLGVLPAEMSENCPEEALKAQAIAARTYAVRNKGRHSQRGCDLCDTTHCQVYEGVLGERARCTRAVVDTKGLVLTYDGELAHVMYSADCGGITENYADLRPDRSLPYLRGVSDPEEIIHRSWEKTYTIEQLADELRGGGIPDAEGLKGIRVAQRSSSGRALSMEITGSNGVKTVDGARLRSILGPAVIKSTLFEIKTDTDGVITFTGKGLGHGVGMCQVGAIALAKPPHNYGFDRILAHYFPGTQLSASPVSGQTRSAAVDSDAPPHPGEVPFGVRVKAPGL